MLCFKCKKKNNNHRQYFEQIKDNKLFIIRSLLCKTSKFQPLQHDIALTLKAGRGKTSIKRNF